MGGPTPEQNVAESVPQATPPAEAAEAVGYFDALIQFLTDHFWVTLLLMWVTSIMIMTEFLKRLLKIPWPDLVDEAGNKSTDPRVKSWLQLAPFLFGAAMGPFIGPGVGGVIPFMQGDVPWFAGLLGGLGAGLAAIGVYDLLDETRPIKYFKLFINIAFKFVVETIFRRKLTEKEEASLGPTIRNQPPVTPEMLAEMSKDEDGG